MTLSTTIRATAGRKCVSILFGIVVLMLAANSAFAATQTCAIINGGNAGPGMGVSPTYSGNQDGRANEGCNVLITFNPDGSITTTNPNTAPSYDNGHDDNMIGIVNNTGIAIASLQFSSVSLDIFGFDGDGVCSGPGWTFSALGPNPNCATATDPNHYGPAGVTFTITNSHSGIVNFGNGGIAPNSSAFFSLEGPVAQDLQVSYPDPVLVLRKSGPATMSLGQWGNFSLDVQNAGGSDAWNVSFRDLLPSGATGGMCSLTPQILSAQVFASDGVTAVAGKQPLNQGSDYSFAYSGAPNCQLNLIMLTAAGTISPNQRLIIHYQTQLDANTQNGVTLTNIAGAIQWFNGNTGTVNRKTYTGPLTNGTPGVLDNQDAFTVTVAGSDPALVMRKSGPATMSLGQWGNFSLDVQNTGGSDAWNVSLRDLLPGGATGGMCNLTPQILSAQVFASDGVTAVTGKGPLNLGSDYSLSYSAAPNCQLNITILTAGGTISANQHLIIHYQTQLDANTQNGVTLTNIAGAIQWFNGNSNTANRKTYTGPLTNGTPGILDNQDAFTVAVTGSDPALVMRKSGPATMSLGQWGNFGLDVQNTGGSDAWNVSLRDLLPAGATGGMCNLTPGILSAQVFAADGVTAVAGKGPLNQGSDYTFSYSAVPNCQLNLTMLTAAGTISPNQRLIIHYQTQLDANSLNGATLTNVAGAIQWFNGSSSAGNRKTYTGPLTNGTPGVLDNQDALTVTVTVSDPALVLRKSGPAAMSLGQSGTFGLDVQNTGGSDAWNLSLRDVLPGGATGGMCNLTPGILSAQVFAADGVTAVAGKGPLTQGSDYSFSYSGAPNCQLNLTILTATGRIGANEHLIIRYQTQLDANSQNGATLTNVAGAIQWFNEDSSVAGRRTFTGPLTNGTPGVLDNQDAFMVTVSGSDPALVMRKSGPATMTFGQWGTFGLDVQNTGGSDAWNVSLRDLLPSGATGGMCNLTPAILSAQVFAADGVTAVAGKGPLNQSSDFSFSYSGAPNCQLNLTILTAAGRIGANEHLIIHYQTQLDANSQNSAVLTNVAGAIQWFNGDISVTGRKTYTGPLTNGTPGVLDNQDAFTLTVTGPDPALVMRKSGPATMSLGQWGNFGLDVQNTGTGDAWNVGLRDVLPSGATGGMCSLTPGIVSAQVFASDGVTAVAGKGPLSQGSDYIFSYSGAPNCQLNITILTSAGTISQNQRLIIQYQTQLDANSQNGATLTNIAGAVQWFNADGSVTARKTYTGPLTNGTPGVLDNQDALTVTVAGADPMLVLTKSGPATMNLGQTANFALDVQNTGLTDAWNVALRDMLPQGTTGGMCNLAPVILSAQVFAADGVTAVAGKGPLNQGADYAFSYSGAPNCQLNLTMLTAAATISATQHLIITYKTQLDANTQNGATLINIAGAIQWFNGDSTVATRKTYTGPLTNGTPGVLDNQDAHTVTVALSGTDPALVFTKSGPATMNPGQTGNFSLDVQNTGGSDAWNVSLRDILPTGATGGMCNAMPVILSAQVFASDGVTAVTGKAPLSQGTDYSFSYSGTPNCQLNLVMLTAAATISATQHLIITYKTQLDANSQSGATLTNIAGAIQWFNGDSTVATRKTYAGALTNGTPGVLDNQDAHTVTVGTSADPVLVLTKSGPATMNPGQTGNFSLDVQNTGGSDAWNVSLRDLLPSGSTGGMCNTTPVILSAQVFAADGVTAVTGKAPLSQNTDYSFSYSGAPNCQVNLVMMTAAATISATQHLIITYRTQLDANSQSGATLTNIAGATQWFNGDSSVTTRKTYAGPLTNGTPNVADNQDAHTVTVGGSGSPQQLSITNQVSVVGGGPAVPGAQLNYLVHVVNNGVAPATSVVITDDLNGSQPGQLTYVNLSATMNSAAAGVSFAGSTITVNYAAVNGPLAPGGTVDLNFTATLNASLPQGTVVTNTAVVVWNTPTQTASASASISVGASPGFAMLSGTLWYDVNFDGVQDPGEPALVGWSVDLYSNNQLVQTVQTDASGVYHVTGITPNAAATPNVQAGRRPQLQRVQTSVLYELRFRAPSAGTNTALLGRAESPFTNGLQRISDIIVAPGADLQGLNLPIRPNGVVYNSVTRTPIAGATLNLLDARSSPLPSGCFDDAGQQGQITLSDGYYRFDLNFSDPACPSGADYLIGIAAPAGGNYVAGYSQIIPPASSASTAAFSVPACPGGTADAVPGTMYCEAQFSAFAPPASVAPRTTGTTYYIHLRLDGSRIPESSQIFNNQIPLDTQVLGSITITKSTPVLNVSRGQLVPYTITANNHSSQLLSGVSIVDRFPAGFTYIKGSAILDGVPTEPAVAGLTLTWNGLTIAGTQVRTLKVLFAVGAGVNGGEFTNRAQALNSATGLAISQEATATVNLVPDPTFDCTDVMGKVFDDKNRNGRQDDGEDGLPGVRVVTPAGLQATTDKFGRYHITCAIVPNDSRGSNFVLKLDDRTLPSGFRMSTDQVQIQRATSGKALQVNFGASIQRVVAIDLSNEAFEPGTTEIRDQWKPRLNLLLDELRKAPAVLRLSYVADTEDESLVKRRVESVKRQLTGSWDSAGSYVLTIEPEVFWRRGSPPKQKQVTK